MSNVQRTFWSGGRSSRMSGVSQSNHGCKGRLRQCLRHGGFGKGRGRMRMEQRPAYVGRRAHWTRGDCSRREIEAGLDPSGDANSTCAITRQLATKSAPQESKQRDRRGQQAGGVGMAGRMRGGQGRVDVAERAWAGEGPVRKSGDSQAGWKK